jgi:hypothetical protein
MRNGAFRSAKKAPFVRAVAVSATGTTFQNALNAQTGPANNPNANASEMILPPTTADGDVELVDVFTGANPVSMFFKDIDGSVSNPGIPLPANTLYTFQATGLFSVIFVGAAASTVTVAVWRQVDTEADWAPADVSDAFDRLSQVVPALEGLTSKLNRIFPDPVPSGG